MRWCLLVVSIVVCLRAEDAGSVALLEERNDLSTHADDAVLLSKGVHAEQVGPTSAWSRPQGC